MMVSGRRVASCAMMLFIVSCEPAMAQQPTQQTCTEAHAYCMQLCTNADTPPPAGWSCEADRCFGLKECLESGTYRIGTQFGHRPPRRTTFGPYERK